MIINTNDLYLCHTGIDFTVRRHTVGESFQDNSCITYEDDGANANAVEPHYPFTDDEVREQLMICALLNLLLDQDSTFFDLYCVRTSTISVVGDCFAFMVGAYGTCHVYYNNSIYYSLSSQYQSIFHNHKDYKYARKMNMFDKRTDTSASDYTPLAQEKESFFGEQNDYATATSTQHPQYMSDRFIHILEHVYTHGYEKVDEYIVYNAESSSQENRLQKKGFFNFINPITDNPIDKEV